MIESSTPETVLALPRPCQLAPIVKAKLPKIEKFRKNVDPALAAGFQSRPSDFPNLFNGRASLWLQKE
ncbi:MULTISPECIES: hypothetical protein [unclassified Rhizobium]|uniref:hypothetical protein n=1 Tax=unclassified Rhizobium TaxID=2613769 RepID=UPI000A2112C7|nr:MULTISPECIES: hypothetical protein [unclassified Rhizobium]ARO23895.1 hypothetical protein TAL182_CH02134 [Rhizobium sp. TAL182]